MKQIKEQGRNSQHKINKEEISNLPEREFRIMIVKMLGRLENRMEKMKEAFNTVNTVMKDIEEIKNKQTEMNNTITEIKNTLEETKPGFNSMQTVIFQMFKLDLEKAEEPEIKLPTYVGSSKKQESSRKTSNSVLFTIPKPLTMWITTN